VYVQKQFTRKTKKRTTHRRRGKKNKSTKKDQEDIQYKETGLLAYPFTGYWVYRAAPHCCSSLAHYQMLSSRLGRSSSARRWLFLSVRSATSSSVTTAGETATTGRFTLASWQKNCWDSYLATGRGSDDLFRSIDSDQTKKISKQELDVFLQSVNYKGVHPRVFKMLDELASDHEITLREFKSWLVRSYNHPYLLIYAFTHFSNSH
jgi:hypothetical protein